MKNMNQNSNWLTTRKNTSTAIEITALALG